MFKLQSCISRKFLPCRELFCLKRTIKTRKISDPALKNELPVYDYPKKKSGSNIIYVWGLGEHGALGHHWQKRKKMKGISDPRFRTYTRPLRHIFGEIRSVTDVAAGYGFSLYAVKCKGDLMVYGTGVNTDSQLGYQSQKRNSPLGLLLSISPVKIPFENPKETKVIGVAAGRAHSVVVTNNEGVYTFGNNAYGQCGRHIVTDEQYEGSHIVHNIRDINGLKIVSAECGQDHTLFLMEDGSVYSCGWGADGQTGLGHTMNQSTPSKVLGDIQGERIVKLSSKSDCVLALNDKGDVFAWGNSEYCQILHEGSTIQQVNKPTHLKKCSGFGKIIDVAAGGSLCMMLNEAGEVFTWGFGILGRGPQASLSWTPEIIPSILFGTTPFSPNVKVESIYAGLNHFAAINSQGDLYTWGKNKEGCLGLMIKKDQYFPLKVCISAICKKVSLGVDHSIALCGVL